KLSDKLNTEGWNAHRRTDFSSAIYFYELAREASIQSHDRYLLSVATCGLARSYYDQGDLSRAVQYYLESKGIWEQGASAGEKTQTKVILAELGQAYRKMGQTTK